MFNSCLTIVANDDCRRHLSASLRRIHLFFLFLTVSKEMILQLFFQLSSDTSLTEWHTGYFFITHPYLLSRILHNKFVLLFALFCLFVPFTLKREEDEILVTHNVTRYLNILTWESGGRERGRERKKKKTIIWNIKNKKYQWGDSIQLSHQIVNYILNCKHAKKRHHCFFFMTTHSLSLKPF